MFSYHHWDEDEEEGWNWYIVAGYSPYYNTQVTETVAICAAGYEEAMNVYQILLQLAMSK